MAVHQVNPQGGKLAALDPIWDRIRGEAEDILRREPELASFIYATVLHHVGHRLDGLVDPLVDPYEVPPSGLRQHDVAWLRRAAAAFARIVGTEFDPADRRTRNVTQAGVDHVAGLGRHARRKQNGGNRQTFPLSPEPKHRGPRSSCWDHVSHKAFAPPLSTQSRFDANTGKSCGEFELYLNRIRVKFETTAIDSNFMH